MNGCHIKPEQFFNLIFGFESIVEEAKSNTDLNAGTNYLSGTPVPTGKVWKITNAHVIYAGTVPSSMQIVAAGLAGGVAVFHQVAPVSWQFYPWNGGVYLQAGDYMQAIVYGATLHDDLYFQYAGVQMIISQ